MSGSARVPGHIIAISLSGALIRERVRGTLPKLCRVTQFAHCRSLLSGVLTVVLAGGCSGPCIVVRALLDCVVSSLEYSGSIYERGGKKGPGTGAIETKFRCPRRNDRKRLCCRVHTYLRDDIFGKRPDQK